MGTDDKSSLGIRLAAGEWLRTGAVAALLGVARRTVHNMCKDGRIHTRPYLGGKQRVCDPDDVRELMRQRPEPKPGA